jgi:hypothetical protein
MSMDAAPEPDGDNPFSMDFNKLNGDLTIDLSELPDEMKTGSKSSIGESNITVLASKKNKSDMSHNPETFNDDDLPFKRVKSALGKTISPDQMSDVVNELAIKLQAA